MKPKLSFQLIVVPLVMLLAPPSTAIAQGTAFTYQGHLNDGANPAGGTYDLRFTIYDSAGAGNVVAGPVTNSALAISNGLFTVTLDFGPSAFTGADRWLEIAARTNGLGGFATLSPRQKVTATPYAIAAAEVTSANVARLDVSNTTVPATGHPIITSGFITGAVVDNGGSGYTTAPNVVVNDATGSGAIITATVSNGKVASLTVNNAGVNYSPGATLTIGAPPSNAYQIFGSTNFFSGVNRVTNANNVFAGDGSALSGLWRLNGNADTVAGAHFVGTTDNQPIEVKVNNIRALRLEPTTNNASRSNMVNVVAGSPVNFVASGVYAATIAGGGSAGYDGFSTRPNSIASDFGTVGGGSFNRIHTNSFASTIAGGFQNQIIKAFEATIGGGEANRIDGQTASFVEVGSTIGGGTGNTIGVTNFGAFGIIAEGGHVISGGNANRIRTNLVYGTIAGGSANQIHSSSATISGGDNNIIQAGASYSVIAGGQQNTNSGSFGVIPGGHQNVAGGDYSLAGGRRAKANHDGTFVWADSQNSDFASTASNQFLIRASGGVGIGTTDPGDTLRVQGPAALGDLWISPTTGG
ncbi:MAG TPA: hypothetical protein VFZ59_20415, partial [Verrucomicrobiae bacterium]|nr:hypothetical protein [Verrucomicrobiae bacterium]